MTNIRLTIDGKTEFDGDLGNWMLRPPEALGKLLRPDGTGLARQAEHMNHIALAVVDAAKVDQDKSIEVRTFTGGWTLTVEEM